MQTGTSITGPNDDLLDDPDFNTVNYVNYLLPNEQSLSGIDDVISKLEGNIHTLDNDIRSIVHSQANVVRDGKAALVDAQSVIKKLFGHIQNIKDKAEKSEDIVKEITHDIKQLDYAKKNLTSSITALNHLHMLVSGIEKLRLLTDKKQYGEIIFPLQATTQVMQNFESYMDIPQIKEMTNQVQHIHIELTNQITLDFKKAFSGQAPKKLQQLSEGCTVLSVLDSKVRKELMSWFVANQLQEYSHLFSENQDFAWLDKIDRRYAWFKKHLLEFESKLGNIFPANWNVSEEMALYFCHITREELAQLMQKRSTDIDVKTLLFAIQKTMSFEVLLSKRFAKSNLENANSITEKENDENSQPKMVFINLIGKCFEPYLYIYLNSLDHNLADLLINFTAESKQVSSRSQNYENETEAAQVLSSCADLFVYYKKCILQCAQLGSNMIMLNLSEIFQKYLREYAFKILQHNLPKLSSNASITSSMSNITRDFRDLSTSNFIQNFQIFSREGEGNRCSPEEIYRICCTLVTAEYCLETINSLEVKLREKVNETYARKINFSQEQDIFNGIICNCIQLLVHDLEMACDSGLSAMLKIQWNSIQAVVDQSNYVGVIIASLEETVPVLRDRLSTCRKYFTQLCVKFVSQFIPKLIQQIYKCKPMNALSTEQLLLDIHILKSVLLELPSCGSQVKKKPPNSYSNIVTKGMLTAEMILKIVMTPTESVEYFVSQCRQLLPDLRQSEFQKILDIKGLRKNEQTVLVEEFKKFAGETAIPEVSSDATANSQQNDSTGIKRLEKLIKKRL